MIKQVEKLLHTMCSSVNREKSLFLLAIKYDIWGKDEFPLHADLRHIPKDILWDKDDFYA